MITKAEMVARPTIPVGAAISVCSGLHALAKSFFFDYCFGLRPVIFQSL